MKKDKTNKNLKKSDGAIKPKWKLWMTIVCVILGVGLIAGVTILGVILARGGTDERPVVPQSIEITYQEDLYNVDNAQLEVTDNFTLTITSPTEGVNRLQVELSLSVPEGQTLRYSTVDGVQYVSNSIITVPQFVNINEPFTVTLDTRVLQDDEGNIIYDENNNRVNWIRGGIASITARSTQNNEADPVSLSVAVDVPVYSTQTVVINSNGEQTDQIILDEQFTLQTKFLPSESQYMFSDNQRYSGDLTNENIRYKRSFYQALYSEGAITPHYDDNGYDMYFQAGEVTTNAITITGYTFRNAYGNQSNWKEPPAAYTINGLTLSAEAWGIITLYNGADGVPRTTIGSESCYCPWVFEPQTGQWLFYPYLVGFNEQDRAAGPSPPGAASGGSRHHLPTLAQFFCAHPFPRNHLPSGTA